MTTPPLPPGFVLDQPRAARAPAPSAAAGTLPPLPPGFSLDDPAGGGAGRTLELDIVGGTAVPAALLQAELGAPAAAAPAEGFDLGGFVGRELRGLGLGVRSGIEGIGDLVGAFGGDAFNAYLLPGDQPSYADAASILADELGLPSPANARERVLGDVGSALTGTAATLGAGGLLNAGRSGASILAGQQALVNPVAARAGTVAPNLAARPGAAATLGDLLTVQPALQAVSAATGAGAAGATREGGGGAGAQIAVGLLGGLAPAGAVAGAPMAIRGGFRGGEANREALEATIRDFGELGGASPSIGQGTGDWMRQSVENLMGQMPTTGSVIARAGEEQGERIGAGLSAVAGRLARDPTSEGAGRAIQRGIFAEGGFKDRFRSTQEALYDRLDDFIARDRPVGVDNTRGAISTINAPIPGAPNTSKFFQNSRIAGIGSALDKDLAATTGAQNSLDDALAKVDALYASRDSAVQDMGRFAAFANEQSNQAHRFAPVPGFPRVPGRYAPQTQRAAEGRSAATDASIAAMGNVSRAQAIESTLDELRAAAEATNGRLPYEAVKKLRTMVGQEIEDAGLMSDFPRSKWKALYRGLSDDMRAAASEAGPDAIRAFERANTYTAAGMKRMEAIEHVIDANGGPERVFQSAMSGTREGATVLRAVMRSLPRDSQREVAGAVIKRMGMANPGGQNMDGDAFSAATFLTNWNKLSPQARGALFDRFGAETRADVDRIARVAESVKDGSAALRNPSGTGGSVAAAGYWGSLGLSLITGNVPAFATLAASGAGANALARVMTNPRFVKWLARTTDMPVSALPAQAVVLSRMAIENDDEDVALVANALLVLVASLITLGFIVFGG